MAAHERIGGSRAQRDLIEYALVGSLLARRPHRGGPPPARNTPPGKPARRLADRGHLMPVREGPS